VREVVASLSGGQRQTVAIARSLLLDPKVILLDEPTAALGVAQTAEVLNLIETLRERGHGVILISHNMADVLAVADRVVVLRLGRNNGVYNVVDVTSETLIAAITGAMDHSHLPQTKPPLAKPGAKAPSAQESAAPPDNVIDLPPKGARRPRRKGDA
jgi:ABC-type sugar transport system ATPase subunit